MKTQQAKIWCLASRDKTIINKLGLEAYLSKENILFKVNSDPLQLIRDWGKRGMATYILPPPHPPPKKDHQNDKTLGWALWYLGFNVSTVVRNKAT